MSFRMGAAMSTESCTAHHAHVPEPMYTEIHHVIPQAWQAFWQPPKPWPAEGRSPDRPGFMLFDARTVALCRTGHGNVHYWLVTLMRQLASYAASSHTSADSPDALRQAITRVKHDARAAHRTMVRAEIAVALEAITRWTEAGGSLDALIARQLWGQI